MTVFAALLHIIMNYIIWGFGQLDRQFKNLTLGLGKTVLYIFLYFSDHANPTHNLEQ